MMLPSRRGRSIVTIHDLFFLDRPDATGAEIRRDYVRLVRSHAQRADAVLANSETTAADVVRKLEVPRDRVCVIHAGLDESFHEVEEAADDDAPRTDDYLLTVATLEPRKNLTGLLRALAILREGGWSGRLRIAGRSGLDAARVDAEIGKLGLDAVVERLGYVEQSALPALYRGARAVVLPSLWEGFGLPLLEAMASRAPLVVSDIPVHREVAGEAAVFAPPDEPEAFAAAIDRVWRDEALRGELVARGRERVACFSWEASARKAVDLYRRVAS